MFIDASVRFLSARCEFIPFRVLLGRSVRGLVHFEVGRVRVIRTMLFATSLQFVVYGNGDVHQDVGLKGSFCMGILDRLLWVSGFALNMVTIFNDRAQVDVQLRARNYVDFQPVIPRRLFGTVVVRIGLRDVRLMVDRGLRVVLGREGEGGLSATVCRGTARDMIQGIARDAFQGLVVFTLFHGLGRHANSPVCPCTFKDDRRSAVNGFRHVTFFTRLLVYAGNGGGVANSTFTLCCLQFIARRHFAIVNRRANGTR